MDIYTSIRNLLASVFSVMFAYFAPIQNMVFVIFFVFAINCMAGMIAGIVAKHERFNLKKFFHCMLETFDFDMLANVWIRSFLSIPKVVPINEPQYIVSRIESDTLPVLCALFRGGEEDTLYATVYK